MTLGKRVMDEVESLHVCVLLNSRPSLCACTQDILVLQTDRSSVGVSAGVMAPAGTA